MPVKKIRKWVVGNKITGVSRRAKFILVNLENSATLIIHLGMTGRLGLEPPANPPAKHDHARWLLDSGLELRFNDIRRFGSVQVLAPNDDQGTIFAGYGPDPFWESFSVEYLRTIAKSRKLPIKNFLMDNRVVTGIGNIYANETLFAVKIHPQTRACDVTRKQWQQIIIESRKILLEAISWGGTTISDYVNSNGDKGYFQTKLLVYGKKGDPCPGCGKEIQKIQQGGRATYFCPNCQSR